MFGKLVHCFAKAAGNAPFFISYNMIGQIEASLYGVLKIQFHDVLRVGVLQKFIQTQMRARLNSSQALANEYDFGENQISLCHVSSTFLRKGPACVRNAAENPSIRDFF